MIEKIMMFILAIKTILFGRVPVPQISSFLNHVIIIKPKLLPLLLPNTF